MPSMERMEGKSLQSSMPEPCALTGQKAVLSPMQGTSTNAQDVEARIMELRNVIKLERLRHTPYLAKTWEAVLHSTGDMHVTT